MVISIKLRDNIFIDFEIDEQDLHFVIGQRCRAAERGTKFYLYNMDVNKYVHRMIMGSPAGMWIDHIDNNPTNNCRSNLRIVEPNKNSQNQCKRTSKTTSKYKGVSFCKMTGKWRAYINVYGKRIDLGRHSDEVVAAQAYNTYAQSVPNGIYLLNKIEI